MGKDSPGLICGLPIPHNTAIAFQAGNKKGASTHKDALIERIYFPLSTCSGEFYMFFKTLGGGVAGESGHVVGVILVIP